MTVILSILYVIGVIFYLVFSSFIIYHLIKYSVNSELNIIMLPLFVIVSIGLLIPNIMLFSSIDWNFLLSIF
jgi:hypothetical protein